MSIKHVDGGRPRQGQQCEIKLDLEIDEHESDDTLRVAWQIRDENKRVLASGEADSSEFYEDDEGDPYVRASAELEMPEGTTDPQGKSWTVRWKVWIDGERQTSTEAFEIDMAHSDELGIFDVVGLSGDAVDLRAVLAGRVEGKMEVEINDPKGVDLSGTAKPQTITKLEVEPRYHNGNTVYDVEYGADNLWMIYNGGRSEVIVNPIFDTVSNTAFYTLGESPTPYGYDPINSYQLDMAASLDPYMVRWRQNKRTIGTSQLWMINNTIASMIHDMQSMLERHLKYTSLLESAFTNADYVQFLKMGRDRFNLLVTPTNFTMVNAEGSFRAAWLTCALYAAATSRSLEEALKTFDFSGASTSLNIDLSGALEGYRAQLDMEIETQVKPFKRQLDLKSVKSGDGSAATLMRSRPMGTVTMPISSVGQGGFSQAFSRRYRSLTRRGAIVEM